MATDSLKNEVAKDYSLSLFTFNERFDRGTEKMVGFVDNETYSLLMDAFEERPLFERKKKWLYRLLLEPENSMENIPSFYHFRDH